MSDRIAAAFAKRMTSGQKALITFVTAGDPDLETTERIVHAMIKAGADLVELGIPYSDPIAEGPVIQAANERARRHGIRMEHIFALTTRIRNTTAVPMVLLLYVNVIVQYGADRFFSGCSAAGLDGVIVPDLPYEERGEVEADAIRHGIALIRIVTPVSGDRIRMIANGAEGFLYCVSSMGVTGVRKQFDTDFDRFFRMIDAVKTIPTALGFGISDRGQVRAVKRHADGIIVGSAMVSAIAEAGDPEEAVLRAEEFTRSLRHALDD